MNNVGYMGLFAARIGSSERRRASALYLSVLAIASLLLMTGVSLIKMQQSHRAAQHIGVKSTMERLQECVQFAMEYSIATTSTTYPPIEGCNISWSAYSYPSPPPPITSVDVTATATDTALGTCGAKFFYNYRLVYDSSNTATHCKLDQILSVGQTPCP